LSKTSKSYMSQKKEFTQFSDNHKRTEFFTFGMPVLGDVLVFSMLAC